MMSDSWNIQASNISRQSEYNLFIIKGIVSTSIVLTLARNLKGTVPFNRGNIPILKAHIGVFVGSKQFSKGACRHSKEIYLIIMN